jgi:surface protein
MDQAIKRRRLNPVSSPSLPEELLPSILSHLDVVSLIQKKRVCRSWRDFCTVAIDAKRTPTTRKAFSTNQELRQAVETYCWEFHGPPAADPEDMETIAQTYGYPINKWDVSTLQDFSSIFRDAHTFNEDISSWNVSNATTMEGMFRGATAFHQDLSSWNVKNVTNMKGIFRETDVFNGNKELMRLTRIDRAGMSQTLV